MGTKTETGTRKGTGAETGTLMEMRVEGRKSWGTYRVKEEAGQTARERE